MFFSSRKGLYIFLSGLKESFETNELPTFSTPYVGGIPDVDLIYNVFFGAILNPHQGFSQRELEGYVVTRSGFGPGELLQPPL